MLPEGKDRVISRNVVYIINTLQLMDNVKHISVFWFMTSCDLTDGYQRFGAAYAYSLHLQVSHLQDYLVSKPRTPQYKSTLPWKP
jgi:hypothetical protein